MRAIRTTEHLVPVVVHKHTLPSWEQPIGINAVALIWETSVSRPLKMIPDPSVATIKISLSHAYVGANTASSINIRKGFVYAQL